MHGAARSAGHPFWIRTGRSRDWSICFCRRVRLIDRLYLFENLDGSDFRAEHTAVMFRPVAGAQLIQQFRATGGRRCVWFGHKPLPYDKKL